MGICENRTVIITGAAARAWPLLCAGLCRRGRECGGQRHRHIAGRRRARYHLRPMASSTKSGRPGGKAIANYEDITDWDAAKRIVDAAVAAFGDLHVVVNNAGIVRDRMFVSATLEEWDATMHVHLRGHFCLARHAVITGGPSRRPGPIPMRGSSTHRPVRAARLDCASGLFDREGRDRCAHLGSGGRTWPLWHHRQRARPIGPHPDDRGPLPTRWRPKARPLT
jgi:NAD(P)-dependent dehydrogenase (short-subunit alcohol dehydrogenase family)